MESNYHQQPLPLGMIREEKPSRQPAANILKVSTSRLSRYLEVPPAFLSADMA